MFLLNSDERKTFVSFFFFGLINNFLYVIILSAAIDLVGPSTSKSVVLLADIVPALVVKLASPFFIHRVPYTIRIFTLVALSSLGMIILSTTSGGITMKMVGILMASLSSGFGEVTFLQLTHYYPGSNAIGGFSTGTGGAGLFGSFIFMTMTNVLDISARNTLLSCAVVPLLLLLFYFFVLPPHSLDLEYSPIPLDDSQCNPELPSDDVSDLGPSKGLSLAEVGSHLVTTLKRAKPLVYPFMLPLCAVYVAEYVINQGISPTLLFPLEELPKWLFSSYRDIYVVYGFLYQAGVFVSRSSVTFGFRVHNLTLLAFLQMANVVIAVVQSTTDFPFISIGLLLMFSFYEGLLGGLLYVNTFVSVSETVSKDEREFLMGCVGISDSFGIMLAGCFNLWLEPKLCSEQVNRGRSWCLTG